MRTGTQAAKLVENWESTIIWRGGAAVPEVRCAASVLAEIGDAAMSGYRRYPWGGVEIGGLLFGKQEAGVVQLNSIRAVECEHHYGPAFELSERDCEGFEGLLAGAAADEELAGLTPVGWYQSTSRRDMGLSQHGRAFFQRFFPEPWQVAMMVQRSKSEPLAIGFFVRDSHGGATLHSSVQEFTLDQLRPQAPEPMRDEQSVRASVIRIDAA